jgi:glutaminyl-peptide cyclotransferase
MVARVRAGKKAAGRISWAQPLACTLFGQTRRVEMTRIRLLSTLAVLGVALLAGRGPLNAQPLSPAWLRSSGVPVLGFQVVNTFAHDPSAFTQGLVFSHGCFYESTGLYGRSTLRRTAVETGRILQQHLLPPDYFAEGLARWQDRLIQLTWKSGRGFVYERSSLKLQQTFGYEGQGWGLTNDDKRLVMSDGTPVLRFMDPFTFEQTGRLTVRLGTTILPHLNELEMVEDQILANLWTTDMLARIHPITGQVTALIDLAGLLPLKDRQPPTDVLNGIAYDSRHQRLFVTGKFWPKVYEIRVVGPR